MTLAEIDDAIARDEATLAEYRQYVAEREAEGQEAARARELVRLVEERLALLRQRRLMTAVTAASAGGSARP